MKLLDTNVWLAAVWARHRDHDAARRWFDDEDDDLVLCRVTEMALLRLLTNPAVTSRDTRTRRQAWDVIVILRRDPRVQFALEPEGLEPLWMTYSKRDDRSHLLWTDDYLAAFAQAGGFDLVTMDAAMAGRYPAVSTILIKSL